VLQKSDRAVDKVIATDRTSEVLSFVRYDLSLSRSVSHLLDDYQHAQPFPHLVLDGFFPPNRLDALLAELPSLSNENWVHVRHEGLTKSNFRSAVYLQDDGYAFTSMLHSAGFLYFLTEVTGIKALLPDPYLRDGGYHVMEEGGKFDVHADSNTDHYCGLHRRLGLIVYLNKDWKPEFGGQLELWNHDATRCEKVIEPLFNRTVIFEVADANFHAVRPVASGLGVKRKSFAAYFHTVTRDLEFHNSIYAPPIYREKEPLIHRTARATLPPILWDTLKKLRKRIS
jgi:2OG-Fe(II) oxygenase superfamily